MSQKLDREIIVIRARIAAPLAHAFTSTFWWAVGLTAVALLPAVVLAFTARVSSPEVAADAARA